MRPRIGITASTRHDDGSKPASRLGRAYVDAVVDAGGLPLVLPVLDPSLVDPTLAALDALVLSGGADVAPARYGRQRHPDVYGVDPERDAWELALARAATERGTPVLAICRGQQVLNVACGGTLVQHLPTITDVVHRSPDGSATAVHPVEVMADSLLRHVLGTDRLDTNTSHHQAVDRVGAGLRACAWSPDGTIEGIEAVPGHEANGPGHPRSVLGVQWHPELLTAHPSHHALFHWLVEAAATTAAPRPHTTAPPAPH